jgi:cell division protein FtsQ
MARDSKKPAARIRWRLWLGAGALAVGCISTVIVALKVRDYMYTEPRFALSRDRKDALILQGLNYASRSKVQRIFTPDFNRSIFSVPLAERRRRLLAIDWVEDASVSRIWPDRLEVVVWERRPVAFVFFRSGVLLIDSHGVLLDPPSKAQFTYPVLSGVREEETELQRQDHVRALMRVEEELGPHMKDVSEVNAADPDEVRIVAQVQNRTVELMMGDGSYGRRFQNFLNHYSEIRRRSPEARLFDLRLDDRITAKD